MTAQDIAEKVGSYVPDSRQPIGEWFDGGKMVGVSLTIGSRHFGVRFPAGHSDLSGIADGIRERAIATGELAPC